jgi:hypothetical protein
VIWSSLASADFAAPQPKWAIGERIRFVPYVANLDSMRWVNRPTFQQVISFGG